MNRQPRGNWSHDRRSRGTDQTVIAADSDMTDSSSMARFLARCRRSLRVQPPVLVIDLQQVEFADTKLVACLVFLFREAQRLAVRIEFRMSVAAETVIRLCRLDDMIGGETTG